MIIVNVINRNINIKIISDLLICGCEKIANVARRSLGCYAKFFKRKGMNIYYFVFSFPLTFIYTFYYLTTLSDAQLYITTCI